MASLELIDRVEAWLEILDASNYYELLGLLEIADDSAIQHAFHEFSEAFHPDRHRGEPEVLRQAVTRIFQRGAEAYGVLRDPRTRSQYDLALAQGQLRFNPGHTAPADSERSDLVGRARSAGGRLHARQFARALSEANEAEAMACLRKMLLAEDGNQDLERCARQLLENFRNSPLRRS